MQRQSVQRRKWSECVYIFAESKQIRYYTVLRYRSIYKYSRNVNIQWYRIRDEFIYVCQPCHRMTCYNASKGILYENLPTDAPRPEEEENKLSASDAGATQTVAND
jgi:hypothetical protein